MDYQVQNLRLLLYKLGKEVGEDRALELLAARIGCSQDRMQKLLSGQVRLTAEELENIEQAFGISGESFLGSLAGLLGIDVFTANVHYLLGEVLRQIGKTKKELARCVGVNPNQVSQWHKQKTVRMRRKNIEKLKECLGLDHDIDLERDMLFLTGQPVSDKHRREKLKEMVDQLPAEELRKLYPALTKLLETR